MQTRPIAVFTHVLTHLSRCFIVHLFTKTIWKKTSMRPISVFTLMLTRLSRCSIVTLFVEILCPSALSLPAPLLMAYYLHLQITYIMICTHASLMLLYLRKSRIYGQITWIYEQITYFILVTEITDNFIFVERERREMLEDTTMSTDKSLIPLPTIWTYLPMMSASSVWGFLRGAPTTNSGISRSR